MREKPRRADFGEPETEGLFHLFHASRSRECGNEAADGSVLGHDDRGHRDAPRPCLAAADAALAARSGPTIRRRLARPGLFGFVQQEIPPDPAIDALPREYFGARTFPQIIAGMDPCLAERLFPAIEAETVAPSVEAAAEMKGLLNQPTRLFAPPGKNPLEKAHPGVMPLDADIPVFQAPPEKLLPVDDFSGVDLPLPLERGMGLGDKGREADRDLAPVLCRPEHPMGEFRNSFQVLLALIGKAEHEIEFHRPPSGLENPFRCGEEFLFRIPLVDHVAEALRSRLGRQREARLPDPPDFLDQAGRKGFGTHRRQREGDASAVIALHQVLKQGFDPGVVAGAERKEGDLVVTRRTEHRLGHLFDNGGHSFPDRPPDHPCLAETATPRASPGNLNRCPVVHGLHQGDDRAEGMTPCVRIGDDALANPFVSRMDGRYVNAV